MSASVNTKWKKLLSGVNGETLLIGCMRIKVGYKEVRGVLDNHKYNLMIQIVQENKSLWRIRNKYLADAGDCKECKKFWEKMIEDKVDHVDELMALIKDHVSK